MTQIDSQKANILERIMKDKGRVKYTIAGRRWTLDLGSAFGVIARNLHVITLKRMVYDAD